MRKGAGVGRNTNTKLHPPLCSVAVALNSCIKQFFALLLPLLLLLNFTYADGRTASDASHQTLFSNVITSYTDANAVTIADAQGLVTTGKVSIGTASTIDEGLTIAHSTGAIGLRPSGQSGVQIRNNAGRFEVNTGGGNEFVVLQNGNVGIGTAMPAAFLDIQTNTPGLGTVRALRIGSTGDSEVIYLSNEGTIFLDNEIFFYGSSSADDPLIDFGGNTGMFKAATNQLGLTTGGTERIRIDSLGNVGIGTASNINEKLTMVGNIGFSSSSGVAPDARLQRGTLTDWQGNGRTAIQSTHPTSGQTNIFEVMSGGEAQIITLQATNPPAIGTRNNNALVLLTNNAERVRIDSSGNVGIGRIPTANRLEVEGTASKTTAGDWLANSDIRIKTDVQDIENALDAINKLRPVKFRYTDEYRTNHSIEDKYYYNFIAQEFKEVFPNSVKEDGEGYLQLDAYPVRPYLVAAVQELAKENEALKQRIEALENKK